MSEMDLFLKEFGKTLKVTRKQMGLSQVSAAQSMHIDYRHYQNIEGGKINLRLDTLIKLVKFYNLDKSGRPFNLDSCLEILSGHAGAQRDAWRTLYQHFVECGQAGFMVVNHADRSVVGYNEKLARTLGLTQEGQLKGISLSQLLAPESLAKVEDLLQRPSNGAFHPFVISFRTANMAQAITMMAVLGVRDAGQAQVILFDRHTLDEEGNRLKDVLVGYQQFMKLNPELKAV